MNRTQIIRVEAWEALDSRGTPTVAAAVRLNAGAEGIALAPAGASTGRHEARERRDGGNRFAGRGVRGAVAAAAGEIAQTITGTDASDQEALDAVLRGLDGTANLGRLGANAVLAVSLAAALATARAVGLAPWEYWSQNGNPSLPLPMINVLSGGAHAGSRVDIQDVLCVPVGASSFAEAIEWASRVRSAAAELASEQGLSTDLVADEGGLGLRLQSNVAALELLHRAIERSALRPGDDVAIAIDVAATQFERDGVYELRGERRRLRPRELVTELEGWCAVHPVVSIEDPLGEDDWEAWQDASHRLTGRQLVGDDLFATDPNRVERGIMLGVANAVLIKVNQAGTLSDALRTLAVARRGGMAPIISARSGDTEQSWLADLAVGTGAGQIKVGSTTRSERTAKWNRILELESRYGDRLPFVGDAPLTGTLPSRSHGP